MKPTIGRVVHYHPEPGEPSALNIPLLTWAALIVDVVVLGDTREPHLQVFPPGQAAFFVPNARYSETPDVGHWNWPPRE